MNTSMLIGVAAGYLIASPAARADVLKIVKQIAGQGIDALNKAGGVPQGGESANVETTPQ